MTDMMSPVAVAVVLVLVIRFFGARAIEGEHPGEKGYDPADH